VRCAAVIAFTLAIGVTACGRTEIDEAKAEEFVRSYFTPDATSADCPGGVEAEAGETLECTAVDTEGRRFRVTAHVVDGEGRLRIDLGDVKPAS
jgi:hypothetical protein